MPCPSLVLGVGREGGKGGIAQESVVFITATYCTVKQEAASQNHESDRVKEAKEIATC